MDGQKEREVEADVSHVLTGVPLGPERPLSPGIPAGPCYKGAVINYICPPLDSPGGYLQLWPGHHSSKKLPQVQKGLRELQANDNSHENNKKQLQGFYHGTWCSHWTMWTCSTLKNEGKKRF